MSAATEAVQWLLATGALDQLAKDHIAPAVAAAVADAVAARETELRAQYEAAIRVLRHHERDGYNRSRHLASCIECDEVEPDHHPECAVCAVLSHPLAKEVTP